MNAKAVAARLLAISLLAVPGLLAAYGFLEMKNAVFDYMAALGEKGKTAVFDWARFLLGLLLLGIGVGFVSGWIFYRDRKRNYVAPRFKAKKKKRNTPPR